MQSIAPVTADQLRAAGQVPLMKVEIYVDAAWVNLCTLDAKNYVEDIFVSLGGASMTPKPIGGALSAMLSNENGIFHPQHPTSGYEDYLKTGRKVRISIGAKYGGTDYYWQRVIGYIDEPRFEALNQKVGISGGDYMKLLQDTELRIPDNYWGTYATFDSFPSDGKLGTELYNEVDAMDINNEADNVTNWTPANCTFVSLAEVGGGSTYVGKMTMTSPGDFPAVKNTDVGSVTIDKEYKVTFKYIKISGSSISASIFQNISGADVRVGIKGGLSSTIWAEETVYFTAKKTGAIEMWLTGDDLSSGQFWIDQISIWEYIPYWKRYYQLPVGSKGPYYVTIDEGGGPIPCWQGEEDEGWYYIEDAESGPDPPAHPARIVFFDINKTVVAGTNNLVIYYFTAEAPENAVARLLFKAGLYVSEAAALADMEYTATGITIDKIWFEPGSTCRDAIELLCERCDYRFHFKWDGTPVFKPKPTPGAVSFAFTAQKHISSFSNYQSWSEIKNRIIIMGMKQAEPVNKEETMPPELKGEAYNQASIDAYGERTLTITNHLFQTQAPIDAMCASLLAEYKDPKWYSDVEVPFNPVPLEKGDKMGWKERLSPVLEIAQTGVIRDIKIEKFNTTYKCVVD